MLLQLHYPALKLLYLRREVLDRGADHFQLTRTTPPTWLPRPEQAAGIVDILFEAGELEVVQEVMAAQAGRCGAVRSACS